MKKSQGNLSQLLLLDANEDEDEGTRSLTFAVVAVRSALSKLETRGWYFLLLLLLLLFSEDDERILAVDGDETKMVATSTNDWSTSVVG